MRVSRVGQDGILRAHWQWAPGFCLPITSGASAAAEANDD
jgi:hypothetical protein